MRDYPSVFRAVAEIMKETGAAVSYGDSPAIGSTAGFSHDYNQLFLTIQRILVGYHTLEEAFRRMAFNVMAANCDDHTKNISFLLRERKEL